MFAMSPLLLAVLLLLAGIALLVAETVLPAYGMIGAVGLIVLGASVFYAFMAGQWIGVTLLVLMMIGSPFVFMWLMELWPRTPVGKRLVLTATSPNPQKQQCVELHSKGRAVTELRPMGECDFGERRCEAISEYGIIAAGHEVVVVAHDAEGRPIVKGS